MKVVYYAAASLDGFIADADDGVGWLDRLSIDHAATGYEDFFAPVDALVMGRGSYDFVHDYGQWPYGDKPTWVCTTRPIEPLAGCNLRDERDPEAAIRRAREEGVNVLWVVDGGRLGSSLIERGLLTHLSISVMPVLLGSGTSLVHGLPDHVHLRQERTTPMPGFTQIEYRLDR